MTRAAIGPANTLASMVGRLIAQFRLVDLAEAGPRQRLQANVPAFRAFVAGDQTTAARLDIPPQLTALDIGPAHDHGMNPLTPAFIGMPDQGAGDHREMRCDDALDLDGID